MSNQVMSKWQIALQILSLIIPAWREQRARKKAEKAAKKKVERKAQTETARRVLEMLEERINKKSCNSAGKTEMTSAN